MPAPVFEKLLDDLRDLDFRGHIVMAPWGEAMLDDRLAEWLQMTKARLPRCMIEILTNGDLLSMDTFRTLIAAGADEFHVSEHFSVSGGRYVFDEPRQAVLTYRALNPNDRKAVHFDALNRRRIERSERFHNRGGLVPLQDTISIASLVCRCEFVENTLAINFRGDVVLCARQWTDQPTFGNVRTEHLVDIWKKVEFRRIRRDLQQGRFLPSLCKGCRFGFLPDPNGLTERSLQHDR